MKTPANDNPHLGMAAAQLNEESARLAVDGRILMYRSIVTSTTPGPNSAEATMARQDVLVAVAHFLDQIDMVQFARLNVLFGGAK